jgi:hypothetical protein
MKTYKYFFISDNNKEAIGKVKSTTRYQAIQLAAARKQLSIEHFLEAWDVEEIVQKNESDPLQY